MIFIKKGFAIVFNISFLVHFQLIGSLEQSTQLEAARSIFLRVLRKFPIFEIASLSIRVSLKRRQGAQWHRRQTPREEKRIIASQASHLGRERTREGPSRANIDIAES